MLRIATIALVFFGGFVVMVLEMIGVLYLAKDFGGSFYVWTSQIGVILTALSLGYAIGGALADKFQRTAFLTAPLAVAGIFIFFIPQISPPLINAIVNRHPPGQDIPMLWTKLDPAFGSAVIFFLPCFVLAILSPYMIRITARRLEKVGAVSGLIYAASTAGSIGGVFISGYIFIDYLTVTEIFRAMGVLVLFLAGLSLAMDFWLGGNCKAVQKN
jgi:MFS family permease